MYYCQPIFLSINPDSYNTVKSHGVVVPGNIISLDAGINLGLYYYFPSYPKGNIHNIHIVLSPYDLIYPKEYYSVMHLYSCDIFNVSILSFDGFGEFAHIQDNSFKMILNYDSDGALFHVVRKSYIATTHIGVIRTLMIERI